MLNNLIEQTVDPDGTGLHDVTTKYAYDQNANVWADLSSTGTLLARRIYGDSADALIARIDSNGVAWYLTDMLGSVRDITNSSGTLLVHQDFNAWGQMTYQSGATYADRFGFTGRPLDTYTGLENNRNRWYDPFTPRWTTQDPLGINAGDSNFYRYTHNRSTYETDPTGLENGPPPNAAVPATPFEPQRPGAPATGLNWPGIAPQSPMGQHGMGPLPNAISPDLTPGGSGLYVPPMYPPGAIPPAPPDVTFPWLPPVLSYPPEQPDPAILKMFQELWQDLLQPSLPVNPPHGTSENSGESDSEGSALYLAIYGNNYLTLLLTYGRLQEGPPTNFMRSSPPDNDNYIGLSITGILGLKYTLPTWEDPHFFPTPIPPPPAPPSQ